MELIIHGRVVLTRKFNSRPWSYIGLAEYPVTGYLASVLELFMKRLNSAVGLWLRLGIMTLSVMCAGSVDCGITTSCISAARMNTEQQRRQKRLRRV